jgi:PAS domain S-box-containing protein
VVDSLPLEDPAEIERSQRRHQNRGLRWVQLCVALLMLGMALADHLLAPPGESRAYISLSMGGVALLSYLLLRSDRRRWEGPLVVTGILVVAAWSVYSYGSVRSASAFAFLGAVVMAGTYLSLRALLATTVSGVIVLGVLTWAEAGGHLPPAGMLADLRYWLMGGAIMLLIGLQLHHTRKATDEVYLRRLSQMEDRLRLEHERDRSMRRFRRVFQLNPTALLVQTASTQAVVEVNPAFERRFGYTGGQVAGQRADVFWTDGQQWQAHCRLLFEHGHTDWEQALWRQADGQSVEVLVCSELSEDPGGLLILTTVVDGPQT